MTSQRQTALHFDRIAGTDRVTQFCSLLGTVILSRFVGLFLLNLPCADDDDTAESRKYHPSGVHETDEWLATVSAGTVVIVHYELWHRGSKVLAVQPGAVRCGKKWASRLASLNRWKQIPLRLSYAMLCRFDRR